LAIAGPTASGKSALALQLAERLDAAIINADALQVYDGLSVLTARPTMDDLVRVPHYLYGHVDPATRYSVGAWARDAMRILTELAEQGRTAILVGGTGLYFRSLFNGLAKIPEPSDGAKISAQALLDKGLPHLHAKALALDPVAAERVSDPHRLLRIVSVALGTNMALSEWQDKTVPLITDWAGVVVQMPREKLYARIESRFDHMLAGEGLDEAKSFAIRNVPGNLPAAKAIGVAELLAHLRGDLTLLDATTLAKRNSRRLAKRQMTWFRNQHGDWPRVTPHSDVDVLITAFKAMLDE